MGPLKCFKMLFMKNNNNNKKKCMYVSTTGAHCFSLHLSRGAGRPRRPCCRTCCGSPAPPPAASSPDWSRAGCPRRWSPGSLCWVESLRGPTQGPWGKRSPACGVRSKGPVAAAAGAREDVRSSPSRRMEGRLGPPRTSPGCPCRAQQGLVHSRDPVPARTHGCYCGLLPEEGALAHLDSPCRPLPYKLSNHWIGYKLVCRAGFSFSSSLNLVLVCIFLFSSLGPELRTPR